MPDIRRIVAVVGVWVLLVLSACGGDAGSTDAGTAPTTAPRFPMTIENCGRSVMIEKEPTRVFDFSGAALEYLAAAGGLDKIVAVVGLSSDPVYDKAIAAKVEKKVATLQSLGGPEAELSIEAIVATNADLAIGGEDLYGLTVEQLQDAGIPLLQTVGYCGDAAANTRVEFTDIESQILQFGQIFGTEDQAKGFVASMQSRLAEVRNNLKPATTEATAAALFLSPGKLGGYGNQSVSHTQFGLLGLRNVFGDVADRYFEPNLEDLINRDPDYIEVLTYLEPGQQAPTLEDLKAFPGITNVTAVKNGKVVFIPYGYSAEGPTAVEGLQRLADGFGLLK